MLSLYYIEVYNYYRLNFVLIIVFTNFSYYVVSKL